MLNTKTIRALPALLLASFAVACGGDDERSSTSDTGHGSNHSSQGAATKANAGDVDRAFVAQMIPHHEMAVEMARTGQQMAQHEEIRSTADAIVSTQEQEIAQLRSIASKLGVEPAAMPTGSHAAHDDSMTADAETLGLSMEQMGMSMDMDALKDARPFDRAFIDDMIPHHQGAVRMARAELERGQHPELKRIAQAIVSAQAKEILQMNAWRSKWYGKPSPAGGVPEK